MATQSYTNPLTVDFLKANPYLVLDTCHFDRDFTDRLLGALSDASPLEEQTRWACWYIVRIFRH